MLSIFTTVTNPRERGDLYHEALSCYKDLADEVVVVNGGQQVTEHSGVRYINRKWAQEFDWPFIGQQFQRGFKACTHDVVIHADLDFIFHQDDFERIRNAAQQMLDNNLPAMSFYKYQFILPDRYNLKSRLVLMVNKRDYAERIRFDSGGDLCQPSLDGRYISPESIPSAKVGVYNYEKIIKSKEQIEDDAGRMERSYNRHFGHNQYRSLQGGESAYNRWYEAQKGKFNKPQEQVPLDKHPVYIQATIKNLQPWHFGYSGFGMIEQGVYK